MITTGQLFDFDHRLLWVWRVMKRASDMVDEETPNLGSTPTGRA